jgi:hypothetical protein
MLDAEKTYGKTLYGLPTSQEIEEWVRSHATELHASTTPTEILDVLWPLLAAHIQNATFRKCDKPVALKDLMLPIYPESQPVSTRGKDQIVRP